MRDINEIQKRMAEIMQTRETLLKEVESLRDEIMENHNPFSVGEKVAVVDRESGKFKRWAYIQEIAFSTRLFRFDFILNSPKKDGSCSARVDNHYRIFNEKIAKQDDCDPTDIYVEPKIDLTGKL